MVFDEDPKFVEALVAREGSVGHEGGDRFTGGACLRMSRGTAENLAIPGVSVAIRENPGAGEFRYLRFAWRKRGGGTAMLQLADRGSWQSKAAGPVRELRYVGGKSGNAGKAIAVQEEMLDDWAVVTRDLFADFGPITLTGLRLVCPDGEWLRLDSVQLVRSLDDFERVPR
jgi:biopolymer transport protein ExbB